MCLKCSIYLSERMHIVSIYTFPIHFATGYSAQKLRELITFFIIIYKVIYLQRERERKECGKGDSGGGGEANAPEHCPLNWVLAHIISPKPALTQR